MRIAILGMGAIGHVVARALDGRADLLRVDRTRSPLRGGEAPVSVALVTTKTFGTAWAAEQAVRVLAPDGIAITLQNGLGNVETLAATLGPARAGIGVIWVGAQLRADGSLFATGPGQVDQGGGPHVEELASLLRAGGMTVTVVDDPWRAVWRKLVANAAMNPTTALFGCTNGELVEHAAGAPLADEIAREVARVATAAGTPIGADDAVRMWREIGRTLGANRSSMLQDVAAGRPTEVDAINGAVSREGERLGVPAPVNEAMRVLVESLSA